MTRNLLQIINTVQQEFALPIASTVIGNTDLTTNQMLGMAQLEIEELRRAHNWTVLQNEYNLAVNPATVTTGNITLNSNVITGIPSTVGLSENNFLIVANNVPLAARILSIDSSTQISMTMEATGTSLAESITFAQDTYPEPIDFDHFINETWWDRTNHWSLLGPTSPQDDQWHRSGIFATGPRRYFRQQGPYANNYRLWPSPADLNAPIQLVFEYISKYPIRKNGSATEFQEFFTTDADIPLLDDRAIIMGIKWRYWMQKGFAWAALRTDYDNYVERQKARDGGAKKLSLIRDNSYGLLSANNIQDANFPGFTGTNSN